LAIYSYDQLHLPRKNQQLTANAYDAAGRLVMSSGIKWSSSSSSVATVSSTGEVKAIAKGMAIITAQLQSKKATAVVNVLEVPVASIAVSFATPTLSVGQTTQALATLKDAQGNPLSGHTLAWQSSNPAMVTVNASGIVNQLSRKAWSPSARSATGQLAQIP
jgi:uncharacterized protein YjdB